MRKFMRTRSRDSAAPPPPPPNKNNRHANGGAVGASGAASRREDHSTLSRYWSESEWSEGLEGCEGPEGWEDAAAWEDPEFPADWRSIGERRAAAGVVWMRPHELYARPTFLSTTPEEPDSELFATRWRVELGPLGDPHLCCAAAALALTPNLLARVAPHQRPHPARRYKFRFWVWGAWVPVEVDDRLPCRGGRALGARGGVPGDVALPLLEKAYAKLHGSYRALRQGSAARALRDLSGGAVQALALRRTAAALLARALLAGVPRSTLLVAECAARRPHAVTGLARARQHPDPLVRLRALSGPAPAASASAPGLPPADRDLLAARATAPGDYWLSLSEMYSRFERLHLVHVGPDDWVLEPALRGKRAWRSVAARRRWRSGYNAGGAPGGPRAHANPRFHVSVPRDAAAPARRCLVVVSLTQRYLPAEADAALQPVGFSVYAQEGGGGGGGGRRALEAVRAVRAREVVAFLALPAGRYLVVPHTRRAHTDHAFLLRILTDERTDVWWRRVRRRCACSAPATRTLRWTRRGCGARWRGAVRAARRRCAARCWRCATRTCAAACAPLTCRRCWRCWPTGRTPSATTRRSQPALRARRGAASAATRRARRWRRVASVPPTRWWSPWCSAGRTRAACASTTTCRRSPRCISRTSDTGASTPS